MDYDFSGLCDDQLDTLAKKLKSFNKVIIKDFKIALNVINDETEMEHRSETIIDIEDLLDDAANKCKLYYKNHLNEVKVRASKYL